MNKLLEQQNQLYEAQAKVMKSQLTMMKQLADTFSQMDMSQTAESVNQMDQALQEASQAIEGIGGGPEKLKEINQAADQASSSLDSAGGMAEKFGSKLLKLAPAVSAIEGLVGGLKLTKNAMGGLLSIVGTVINSFFSLATAIISVPFKILNGLMSMAAQQGGTELRKAIEDVRAEFGSLAENEGKALMEAYHGVSKFGGELAETGISVFRTMGNMADIMKEVHGIASAMGPTFHHFKEELAASAEAIFAYKKGLGLTDEAIQGLAVRAQASGKSFQEQGKRITKFAFGMGDAFGVNGKLISKTVGEMSKDLENFGSLGVETMASIATQTRRLGLELEDIMGVIDKFDDFESAAESAAQLSQAFGMQVDALKMVKEQDPAARFENLRKAFRSTGRSVEDMTRQERKLLAEQTGLSQKAIELGFSLENQGMSYKEVQAQAEKTKDKQLTQAEAMQKLSDSIERLVKEGQQLKGGFFDIFIQGFSKGLKWNEEFYGVMWSLKRVMYMVYRAGRRVGQMFVRYFPGVSEILTNIRHLFDADRWSKMLDTVQSAFKDFFKNMTENPDMALTKLLERLKEGFFNWFDASKEHGKKILEGFKKFFLAIGDISGMLIDQAMKGITKAMKFITELIRDPSSALAGVKKASKGFAGFIGDVLAPAWEALKENWPALRDAFLEMIETAWKKIKPPIMNFLKENWMIIVGVLFGPAIAGSLVRGLTTMFLTAIPKAVGAAMGPAKAAMGKLSGAVSSVGRTGAGAGAARSMDAVSSATGTTTQMARQTRGFSAARAAQLGATLTAIAAALSAGAVALAGSLVAVKKILDAGGIKGPADAAAPLLVVGATAAGMLAIAPTIRMLQGVGKGVMKAVPGILAVSAVALAAAGTFYGINKMVSDIKLKDVARTTLAVGSMMAMYLAAAGVILAATAIASLATNPGTIVAMISGMALMAGVVTAGTAHAMAIMKEVKKIKIGENFNEKIKAFTSVLTAMGDFAASMAKVLEAATPSFLELAAHPWGRDPEKEARSNMAMVNVLVETIGEEVTNIIETLRNSLRGISQRQLKAADKVASLLSSVGELTKALQPPESLTGGLNALGDTSRILSSASVFMSRASSVLTALTNSMVGIMQRVSNLPSIEKEKVNLLSKFISSVASVMKAIKPGGATAGLLGAAQMISGLASSAKSALDEMPDWLQVGLDSVTGGGVSVGKKAINDIAKSDPAMKMISLLKLYMKSFFEVMKGQGKEQGFFGEIQSLVKGIIGSAKGIEDVKKLDKVIPVFSKTMGVISSFAESMSGEKLKELHVAELASGKGQGIGKTLKKYVTNLVKPLQENIPQIMGSLNEAAKELDPENVKIINKMIPAMESMIGMLDKMTKLVDRLGKGGKGIESGRKQFEARLGGIRDIIKSLFESDKKGVSITDLMSNINTQEMPGEESAKAIQAMADSVSAIAEMDLKGMMTKEDQLTKIADAGEKRITEGVSALVHRIKNFKSVLRSVRAVNLDSELEALNNRLGLKSEGSLKIASEPVNLTVNFQITIDSEELRKGLIGEEKKFVTEQKKGGG